MKLYTPERAAHWYATDGTPMHDADLRVARKMNLLPSVTTVQRAAAKPGLEAWKMTQAVLSALTLPRLDGEPDDAFASRVVKDSGKESSDAAEWGTRMHEICALSLAYGNDPDRKSDMEHAAFQGNLDKHMTAFDEWRQQHVEFTILSETVVTHRLGFAGRMDAHCKMKDGTYAIIDFKGRSIKGKRLVWYPEQVQQLAAYRLAARDCDKATFPTRVVSCVIDRDEPSIYAKDWSEDEASAGERQFLALLTFWQEMNGYWPTKSDVRAGRAAVCGV